jgi:hypothetical protein
MAVTGGIERLIALSSEGLVSVLNAVIERLIVTVVENLIVTVGVERLIGLSSEALVSVLNERVQHQHLLTLMDSLADGLLGKGPTNKNIFLWP